jgi:hypothetical protein
MKRAKKEMKLKASYLINYRTFQLQYDFTLDICIMITSTNTSIDKERDTPLTMKNTIHIHHLDVD